MSLRDDLIKLAYRKPELRPRLMPLIKEAAKGDTFKCPECGSKVLEATGYCVKCEKKVKKAGSHDVARYTDHLIALLERKNPSDPVKYLETEGKKTKETLKDLIDNIGKQLKEYDKEKQAVGALLDTAMPDAKEQAQRELRRLNERMSQLDQERLEYKDQLETFEQALEKTISIAKDSMAHQSG